MPDKLKETVREAVRESPAVAVKDEADLTHDIVAAVKADPVAVNELNQEAWFQSRVANYGSAIGLVALFGVAQQIYTHGLALDAYDRAALGFDAVVLWGSTMVLRGRFANGLKPMWHRLFGGQG